MTDRIARVRAASARVAELVAREQHYEHELSQTRIALAEARETLAAVRSELSDPELVRLLHDCCPWMRRLATLAEALS